MYAVNKFFFILKYIRNFSKKIFINIIIIFKLFNLIKNLTKLIKFIYLFYDIYIIIYLKLNIYKFYLR